MLNKSRINFVLFFVLITIPLLVHADQGLIVPKKDSVYYSLLQGLKLLAVGDIEQWIIGSCVYPVRTYETELS
jgi:hypothetical protein